MPSIRFRLNSRTGVPPYRQLVEQVVNAVNNGRLLSGDRLPSVRDVVEQVTINPNTVHRAYRELEYLGITEAHSGLGTYISVEVTPRVAGSEKWSQRDVNEWVIQARGVGLTDKDITDMVRRGLKETAPVSLAQFNSDQN